MQNDFFSKQSDFYAQYRPTYPKELFTFILSLVENRRKVWDVATGNGQAAISLASYFDEVYASDLSENQLSHASKLSNIIYHKELAEECSLPDESVDLITVATAIHWFNLESFYKQVERVLKPNGVLIAWSYGGCKINSAVDAVIDPFSFEFLFDYWAAGAKMNWIDRYASLTMPYTIQTAPAFAATAQYNMIEVMNYMYSWSGTQEYIRVHQKNPLLQIKNDLEKAWGNPEERKQINWPLHLKWCRK